MIKAIIFDLDNTLINLLKLKQMAVEHAVAAMIDAGLDFSKKEIMDAIDQVYKEKGIEYQHVFDDVLLKLIKKIDYKILSAGVTAYRKVKAAYLDTYPGVIPTLIKLIKRGYKLGIISDAPKLQMWTRLCDIRLQHFFDFVISAEDTEKKPGELPFKKALDVTGLKPGEIMMVGDSLTRDVVGAKRMGMISVLAKYGEEQGVVGVDRVEKADVKPDYVINKFEDLLNLV